MGKLYNCSAIPFIFYLQFGVNPNPDARRVGILLGVAFFEPISSILSHGQNLQLAPRWPAAAEAATLPKSSRKGKE